MKGNSTQPRGPTGSLGEQKRSTATMDVTWKQSVGKKYLYVDYRGAKKDEELLTVLQKQVEILLASSDKVLLLSNFDGVSIGAPYMEKVKEAGKAVGNVKIARSAVVGVDGIKKILLNAYVRVTGNEFTKSFSDEASALDWLLG
jgi:hypothetical protein